MVYKLLTGSCVRSCVYLRPLKILSSGKGYGVWLQKGEGLGKELGCVATERGVGMAIRRGCVYLKAKILV